MEDYRNDVVGQINAIINSDLSQMTDGCREYYLDNWNHYCDELEIERDTSERMYLWICSQFDPEYDTHNI